MLIRQETLYLLYILHAHSVDLFIPLDGPLDNFLLGQLSAAYPLHVFFHLLRVSARTYRQEEEEEGEEEERGKRRENTSERLTGSDKQNPRALYASNKLMPRFVGWKTCPSLTA
jgi:hypothetical protein